MREIISENATSRFSQKMQLRVSAIISQLFQVNMPAKCVLSILGLKWNQRFPDKKTTLKICGQVLAPPTRRQNRSFHVVARKDENRYEIICNYKNAKLFFIVKQCEFVKILSPLSSWSSLIIPLVRVGSNMSQWPNRFVEVRTKDLLS